MSTFHDMKKAQVTVPPRPKMRSHPERSNPVIMQSFYGILYRFDQNNKWESIEQDYIKINLLDYELSEHPYRLEAMSGNEKILDFLITSSTKASAKGAFVKWSKDTIVHGARFSKPDIAEEFCDQLCALSMELNTKLQENAQKSGVNLASRKSSTVSVESNNIVASKATTMVIEVLLSNNELRQVSIDKETPVSGLLDKICNDEELDHSFYTIHYMTPTNSPVPLGCKVANLDSFQLRLVDKRDLQKSANLDMRKAQPEGRRFTLSFDRPIREEKKISYSRGEKDFVLEASDPLVKSFLEIANIHQYELRKPRVHSIVEGFIADRGGLRYLQQLRGSKLSREVLDEIGEISQKVLSLAESPTKSDHQYIRVSSVRETSSNVEEHHDLRRACSLGDILPSRKMEKKERPPSKKKRQAPLPPSQTIATARSSQLTSHSSKDITADIERVEKGEPLRVKRRAPLPPGAVEQPKGVSPSLTDSNSNPTGSAIESGAPTTLHGRGSSLKSGEVSSRQGSRNSSASPDEQGPVLKSPPTFFAPPPPDESPPNEVYSPVGSFSATTPSPTKEFKFMGELAKKLEARRSLIVHSDDDDFTEHQLTPKKGYGTKSNATASEDHATSPIDTSEKEYTGEATPVKDSESSQSKPTNGDNLEEINVEEAAIITNAEESRKSPTVVTNTFNEKDEKRKLQESSSESVKRKGSSEINAGYTVQLLENQMRTIHHSISSLQDIKDEKQRELLLKPLLLQETILQKMIDQEKKNIFESHEAEAGNQVRKVSLELSEAAESRAENTAGLRTEYDTERSEEKAVDDAKSEALRCKETGEKPDIELTQKDGLVKDINKEKAVKMERWKNKEDQSLIRGVDEERMREEAQRREDKEMQMRKEVEKQKEIDEEKRRFTEQKRHMEKEKQKKSDLERNKLEKESCKLDSEMLEVPAHKQNDFLTQSQREEKELIVDKEKKGTEKREKEEEEEKVRQQELEYRKIEEEKRKAELEKQEIELERKQREEERIRLEKELLKLKAEEQQRKENETKKKMEELQEIERLRKELEIQKKIENERLEKERQEIEDLKRQLKEQRELQEKEALEKKFMEEKKVEEEAELQVKTHDKEQQQKELFDVVEKFNLEDENIVSKSKNSESELNEDLSTVQCKPKEVTTEYVSQVSNETVDTQTVSSQAVDIGHDGKHPEEAHKSPVSSSELKSAPERTAGGKFDSKQSVPLRRPSSNLVSSAMRTADGDTSKKSGPGLFAKIQQMANARSSASNVADKKPENIEKEHKDKNLNDIRKKVGDSTLHSSKEQASSLSTHTDVQHGAKPYQQATVLAPKEARPSSTFSPTISEVENGSPIVHQQKGRHVKNGSLSGTEATLLDENQNCSIMKDVNNINKLNGSVVESRSQRVQDTEVTMSDPVHGNLPTAFKPNAFRPTSSIIKEIEEKKGVSVDNHEKDLNELPKVQGKEKTLDRNSTVVISNESKGKSKSLSTSQNDAIPSVVTVGNSEKVHENRSGNEIGRTAEATPDIDAYLPVFSSWSSFSSNGQKSVAANAAQSDSKELDMQGDLGNYRPKCISPDDLRSSYVLEKEKNAEKNPNTTSSAAILRNALGKKAPPKVLPKTLPKTLPKPGSKIKGTSENPTHRETVKNHLDSNSKQRPEMKEKKRDVINIAAIQNRSLEISSGAISSNIMNKTILHDDKRGHSSTQSGERGRTLPNRPNIDVKTGQSVESESVQAPSLLRRLSQNSLLVNSTNPNVSSGYSGGLENEPGKTEITALGKILGSDKAYNEACEPTGRTEDGKSIRVGDYASVIDGNEKRERDTVPVKKVGGLNIGFGRDKPKVYST